MRLIDADKILEELRLDKMAMRGTDINIDTVMRIVGRQETVKAIPIAYILKQIVEEITEDNKILRSTGRMPTTTVSYALQLLIDRWEKENDKGNAG